MRQSFYLIGLQIVAIIVGLFTTLYVAITLPASLFAIIGVHAIITSIIIVFSNSGIETIALRNFLSWKQKKQNRKILIYSTHAFFIRITLAIILGLIVITYAYFISKEKFEGNYFIFFILFIISGIFMAVNDSFKSLLKAHNKFIQAMFSHYFVLIFGKAVALIIFIQYGLASYLYTIIILPVIIFPYLFFLNYKNINIKYLFSKKLIKFSLRQSKHFAFTNYLSFIISHLDQFLISILMSAEILGLFSLIKKLVNIITGVISNFFDPVLQKTIQYKGNYLKAKPHLVKVFKWRNVFIVFMLIGIIFYYFFAKIIIIKLDIDHYPYFYENSIFALIGIFFILLYKIKYYLIAAFTDSMSFFKFTTIISLISIVSFLTFALFFDDKYIFGFTILSGISVLSYTLFVSYRKGGLSKLINSNYI